MLNLEKRIDLEKGNKKPQEITDLNLDNSKATEIEGLNEEFTALTSLSLNNVGLLSLKGLPPLPALERLELSDNRLTGGLQILEGCKVLKVLNLSGNNIKEMEVLKPLAQLSNLRVLDLFSCEVTQLEDYREQVFSLLPQLQYLDGFDRENEEAPDEEDEEDEDGVAVADDEDEISSNDDEFLDEEEELDAVGADGDEDELGEEEDEEDDDPGLEYLNRDDLEDDEEDQEDFDPDANGEEEEDEDEEEEELEESLVKDNSAVLMDGRRGVKRKATDEVVIVEENSVSNGPSGDQSGAAPAAGEDSGSGL